MSMRASEEDGNHLSPTARSLQLLLRVAPGCYVDDVSARVDCRRLGILMQLFFFEFPPARQMPDFT